MRVLCVHPYGVYTSTRNPDEIRGYDTYIDQVVSLIRTNHSKIDAIFVAGGMVADNGVREAESLMKEIDRRLNEDGHFQRPTAQLDHRPRSTIGVVRSCFEYAAKQKGRVELIMLCDRVRQPKTLLLCWRFRRWLGLQNTVEYRVFGLQRPDPHKHSRWYFQMAELPFVLFRQSLVEAKSEAAHS